MAISLKKTQTEEIIKAIDRALEYDKSREENLKGSAMSLGYCIGTLERIKKQLEGEYPI